MIDLNKLKSDHDRYKKALELLVSMYDEPHAKAALNPPPPAPVTLDDLKNALSLFQANRALEFISIQFHKDESGSILDYHDTVLFSFNNFREAVDFLTKRAA